MKTTHKKIIKTIQKYCLYLTDFSKKEGMYEFWERFQDRSWLHLCANNVWENIK
jgi:hypothetical protein